MVVTSVAGHLLELDFVPPYDKWHGCEARQLYEAAVAKRVNRVGSGWICGWWARGCWRGMRGAHMG